MNEYITRERAKELYPIIQAYANGATIQFLSRQQKENGEWIDVWYDCLDFFKEPTFSNDVKYRIKPTNDNMNYAKKKEQKNSSSNDMKHVQVKYGSREDINYFLSTIPSENFISITKEKENRYLLVYIEDEK